MKIVLKEEVLTSIGNLKAGTLLDLPDYIAQRWIEQGKAKAVSIVEKTVIEPSEKRRRKKK
jgi:hypothetical protein